MRVLVTGAAGFIGLNLVEALLAQGHDVAGFDRNPPPGNFMAFPFMEGDVRNLESLSGSYDAVVHAAAITPGGASERARMAEAIEVNVLGTVRVMEAAVRAKCRRVLFLSSASVYGANAYGEEPLDEERHLPSPVALYPVTKLAAERLALRYRELAGLDVVVARLAAAFGPWEADSGARDTLSPFFQAVQLALGGQEAVLPRRSRLDWIYSREAAAALSALLASKEKAVVNVGPQSPYDLERFCAALSERYPKFRWRVGAPANVDLFGPRDRSPLDTRRLRAAGFAARFDERAAYEDYLAWLERQ